MYDYLESLAARKAYFDVDYDCNLVEDLACLSIWLGENDMAHKCLVHGISVVDRIGTREWEFKVRARLEKILAALTESPSTAKSLLLENLRYSANAIHVPRKLVDEWFIETQVDP
jgi:hypothetical protein